MTHTATGRRILHPGSLLMILSGLLMAVGAFLPWVTTPFGSLSGMTGPGLWVLCAGVIAIAGALLPYPRLALAHALVPGIAVAFLVVWQVARLIHISATTDSWGKVLPGIGLVMAGGAAVILLRAAVRIRAAGRAQAAA